MSIVSSLRSAALGVAVSVTLSLITDLVAAPGDNCQEPYAVVQVPWGLPFSITNQTTCGRLNDYQNTCLDYYDNGEDFILQLHVVIPTDIYITLDPKTTTYTGILIDSLCPPGNSCIAKHTSNAALIHQIQFVHLNPGDYYIMVDTWPPPGCIPSFDFRVDYIMSDPWGINCELPMYTYIDSTRLPLHAGIFSTSGMANDYNNTCLGLYDEGEDFIYQLDIRHPMTIDIELDPKGTVGTGMVLSSACPPQSICDPRYISVDSIGNKHRLTNLDLDSGNYYLMVDSKLPQSSIPSFEITIYRSINYLCGDADGSNSVDVSDAVFLIAYIFASGPAPNPITLGDASFDGAVDISDAVYLIAYIFGSGPAPCATLEPLGFYVGNSPCKSLIKQLDSDTTPTNR